MKCIIEECKRETRNNNRKHCDAHIMQIKRHGKIILNKSEDRFCKNKYKYTHTSYRAMLQRCSPSNNDYRYYKNIKICERWLGIYGWDNFFEDMGERPKCLTIERINNKEGYSKENCKWATRKEQSRNTSQVINVLFEGKKYLIKDICDKLGISYLSVVSKSSDEKIPHINAISSLLFRKSMGLNLGPIPIKYKKSILYIENDFKG